MNFFPGETNVKVKEGLQHPHHSGRSPRTNVFLSLIDVTYRSQDRKTTDRGELLVTDFCLLFVAKPPDAARVGRSHRGSLTRSALFFLGDPCGHTARNDQSDRKDWWSNAKQYQRAKRLWNRNHVQGEKLLSLPITFISHILFQDSRQFFFGTAKENHQRRNLFDSLNRLIFPFADSKADISNPEQFFSVSSAMIAQTLLHR